MPISIVIYGSADVRKDRIKDFKHLLQKHGLRRNRDQDDATDWCGDNLRCLHVEIEGTLLGADTDLPIKKFLVEAMKLPGIFDHCPEHCKRDFWDAQEKKFLES